MGEQITFTTPNKDGYTFTPHETAFYRVTLTARTKLITSSGNLVVYSASSGNLTMYNTVTRGIRGGGGGHVLSEVRYLQKGRTYKISCLAKTADSYMLTVNKLALPALHAPSTRFSVLADSTAYFTYTPATSGWHTFTAPAGGLLRAYDGNFKQLNDEMSLRAGMNLSLQAGKTYYFSFAWDKKSTKTVNISVSKPVVETHKVSFNANGGTTAAKPITVTNGATYGTLPTATRTGYKFDGWYTARTGGSKVTASSRVNLRGDRTLYAHWTKGKTVKVTFNANGGKVSTSSKTVTAGGAYGALPTPTRTGYQFDGWYTGRTSGSKVKSTTKVTASASAQTLYARWSKPKTYLITLDPNGGSVCPGFISVVNGGRYRSLPTPVITGKHFAGWYTAKTGGVKVTPNTLVSLKGSRTLYARWTSSPVSVVKEETGTWRVQIPKDINLVLFAGETSPNRAAGSAAVTGSATAICTRRVTLSNGTVRYYGRIGSLARSYWFCYTDEMTVGY